MEKFKGQSIEDVLRQQIQKGEYFDNGGSGARPPGGSGGGGGGGGDSPDETDGPEEESFAEMLDENLQVILATLGFIFLVLSFSLFICDYVALCSGRNILVYHSLYSLSFLVYWFMTWN